MGLGGGTAYGLTVIGDFGFGLLVPSFRHRSVSSNFCPKDVMVTWPNFLTNTEDQSKASLLNGDRLSVNTGWQVCPGRTTFYQSRNTGWRLSVNTGWPGLPWWLHLGACLKLAARLYWDAAISVRALTPQSGETSLDCSHGSQFTNPCYHGR